MVAKAEVLRQLKPCFICGSRPFVREEIDFKNGSVENLWQILCTHKNQKPPLWFELRTKWGHDPEELIERWNSL